MSQRFKYKIEENGQFILFTSSKETHHDILPHLHICSTRRVCASFCQHFSIQNPWNKSIINKKVLVHERKRHTDRGVSSTPYVVLPGGGGCWGGGGGPARGWMGYPSVQDWMGYPPPPNVDLAGVPPPSGPGWGTLQCGLTKWKYNLPFRTTQ